MTFLLFLIYFSEIAQFKDLKITPKELKKFEDFGEIYQVIRLDSSPESLVGSISQAVIDETRNLIYIGDYDSTETIFVFSRDGRYLRTVSKSGQGPGEFKDRIVDMALKSNGNIVILTFRAVLEFDSNGNFVKENRFANHKFDDLITLNDEIYISSTSINSMSTIMHLNKNLELKDSFGSKDPKRDTYSFIPHETLQCLGNELWFSEYYEPILTVYSDKGILLKTLAFPQLNKEGLDQAWNKKPFDEHSRTKIKKLMHRFSLMFPYRDNMLVFDYLVRPQPTMNMYSFSKGKDVVLYKGYNLINPAYRESTLVFTWLVGNFKDGLLCTLEPDEYFMKIRNRYPKLKDLPIKEDDNQLLVLITPF